ncbi:protein ORD isoform X2 [Scaptodrosophila lebanonensis]|uniref:Protein ORD isoform X2 n=1 Tax=Drosophila lebanonensis TaxID=7225 RepID=A0A6J2UGN3_DROLE|nr:protein ORD isoform X2 [Scaptodrosophila lebanonensis]
MDQQYNLQFLKLDIKDCLGCKDVKLRFPPSQSVHLILYSYADPFLSPTKEAKPTNSVRTPILQALQLLCTNAYPDEASLNSVPMLQFGRGSVRLTFNAMRGTDKDGRSVPEGAVCDVGEDELDMDPCTSQQAREREERRQRRKTMRCQKIFTVTVTRSFENVNELNQVTFQIDNGLIQQVTIAEFHNLFFVAELHSNAFLRNLHQSCAGNWLRLFQSNAGDCSSILGDDNPFETFSKLFARTVVPPTGFLGKLTTKCLISNKLSDLAERRFVMNLFNDVRRMFEYVTINEYTVWFYVPRLMRFDSMENVTLEDFDLSSVCTTIKSVHSSCCFFWNNANHSIKDILLIAFQLGLSCCAKQSVTFLSNLDGLSQFITMNYLTAFFMNHERTNSSQWVCQKYFPRIIDLCVALRLTVFIEYPGALTLLPSNRFVIKCKKQRKHHNGEVNWSIYEDITKESSLDNFMESICTS